MNGEYEHPRNAPAPVVEDREGRALPNGLADAMLPVPSGPLRRQSTGAGFWKRLSIRRSVRRAQALVESSSNEPILIRLDKIDGQLSAIEDGVTGRFRIDRVERQLTALEENLILRFERLDHRFLQLWEIEERLTQLDRIQESLEDLRETQSELKAWAIWLRRGILWSGLFAGLAVTFTVCMLTQ